MTDRRVVGDVRLVVYWYGWRDFWWRRGPNGPGWSVQPARDHWQSFRERRGMVSAWHVAGLCIKRLRPERWSYNTGGVIRSEGMQQP